MKFKIECEPETQSVRGYFGYDTEAENKEAENAILAQLESGNEWAWCSVRVYFEFSDGQRLCSDWLGCCSYASEADFRDNSGYFDDMCGQIRQLIAEIR